MAITGAMFAIVGAAIFTVVLGWLHLQRRDLSPRVKGISHYAVGPTRRAMTTAFVALALGLVGAVLATAEQIPPNEIFGRVLVACAAVGILVVAAVPVPGENAPAWAGPAHTGGALLFLIASASGALVLSAHLGQVPRILATGLLGAVGLFFLSMAGVPGLFAVRGWLQRACFAVVVVWLVVVGWQFAS